jgi:hypothetical protein
MPGIKSGAYLLELPMTLRHGYSLTGRRWQSDRFDFQLKSGSRMPARSSRRGANRNYHPGDTVRQSGIYEVVHDRDHRESHEVVLISGDKFPACETCREQVRFKLVRAATYIFYDQDFESGAE